MKTTHTISYSIIALSLALMTLCVSKPFKTTANNYTSTKTYMDESLQSMETTGNIINVFQSSEMSFANNGCNPYRLIGSQYKLHFKIGSED